MLNDHSECVVELLKHGAEVNCQTDMGGTVLMEAAYKGDVELVELLLDYEADVIKVMNNGVTAKMLAHSKGHDEIAELLSVDEDSLKDKP